MTDHQTQMSLPRTIGRYEVRREVGRGGMATVYQGRDPRFDRDVAIKVLPHAFMHDPTFRGRFEREAKTIAMLEHSAIVPVYDFGEENGQPYLVMRFMPGGSLAERIAEAPLPLAESARIMSRLASALDDAHAIGIIHRDLKPGNILFDKYNDPYVADFGIAKISEATAAFTGSTIIGTPAYMSPEQARGEAGIDGRSDIYSLGAILFEMLTGELPYDAETPMGIAMRHITDPIPRILEVNPNLPVGCEALIEKAMAKDREDRFQTAREFAEAVQAVARGELLAPTRPAHRREAAAAVLDEPQTIPLRAAAAVTPAGAVAVAESTVASAEADTGPMSGQGAAVEEPVRDPSTTGSLRRVRSATNQRIAIGIVLLTAVMVAGRLLKIPVERFVWPGYIIVPGALILYLGYREREKRQTGLTIAGTVVTTVGVLLLYQSIFGHWASWAYAWALVGPFAAGLGIALAGKWGDQPGLLASGIKVGRIGLILFAVGWFSFEVILGISQQTIAAVLWAPVLTGVGVYFLWRYLTGGRGRTPPSM